MFMVGIRSLGATGRLGLSQSSQGCVRALLGEQSDRTTDTLLERDVGGRVGSQGLSVLSVQCYPLLPGLLLGFPREFTFSVNIFGSQPG